MVEYLIGAGVVLLVGPAIYLKFCGGQNTVFYSPRQNAVPINDPQF